jgi:cation diffusion facilitator family transporter
MVKTRNIRAYYSRLEGWVSIIVNILLAVLKYWAGIVSGSIALLADALHTLSDSISSIVVIVGSRLSSKPADKDHPFGHGRFEFISTFIISVLLFIIAFSFFRESVIKIKDQQAANYGTIAIIVTIISILGKEALARFAFWTARKSGSQTLHADGWHHRTDSISSLIILIGIIGGGDLWWIDGILGIIIALFIAWTAFKISRKAISSILGERPEQKIITEATGIANRIAGEDSCAHHFHIHNYVTHFELTFHLLLDSRMNINEAHETVSRIEKEIKTLLDIEATIHIEPKA